MMHSSHGRAIWKVTIVKLLNKKLNSDKGGRQRIRQDKVTLVQRVQETDLFFYG